MELPAAFEKRMQDMLGAEYTSFRASYNEPHKRGIRLNTVKCTKEQLERALPFTLVQTPFSPLKISFSALRILSAVHWNVSPNSEEICERPFPEYTTSVP